MKLQISKTPKSGNGLLIVPVFTDQLKSLPKSLPEKVKKFLEVRIKKDEFKGKKGDLLNTYLDEKGLPEQLVIIGMGDSGNISANMSRVMGGTTGKFVLSHKQKEITVFANSELDGFLPEFLEGILMSHYKVEKYKTIKKDRKKGEYHLEKINIITNKNAKTLEEECKKAIILAEAVYLVRDLVNGPANIIDSKYLVNQAKQIAKENKYKITALTQKQLEKMKWGGLLAVNQGARDEAACVVLEYYGAKNKNEKPLLIVGKGMIFDSGGYNLKPTSSIETMQQDMAGAATVLGLFSILKKMGIKKNVVGITPIAENMINEHAYRPSDIITMLNGMTVEITNTDAEGRLILADAITHGKTYKPEKIVTIATLTGAVAIAVGHRYSGLIANNKNFRKDLQKAGQEVDDLGWPLPLHPDYLKKMDSQYADIRNADLGSSRYAGSSKGAAFLARFIEKDTWCHIDIGGTAFTDDPKTYETKGATAHGLRMLLRYLEK